MDKGKAFHFHKGGRLKSEDAHHTVVDYSHARMKQSLETLGVDYIDLLFLHEPYLGL